MSTENQQSVLIHKMETIDPATLQIVSMIGELSPTGLALFLGGMIWRECRRICEAAKNYQPTLNVRLSGESDELSALRDRIEEIAAR